MKVAIESVFLVMLTILIFNCCASLQQPPAAEIHFSRLASPDAPRIVDGNLKTVDALQTDGYVEKRYAADYRLGRTFVNSRQIVGTKQAGALIALAQTSYVTHIEIYASSPIAEPMIDVVTELPSSGPIEFTRVSDRKIGKHIGAGEKREFRIGQKIRYLRIRADGVEDTERTKRTVETNTQVTRTPLKGPLIKEVKFYEIPQN